MSNLRVPLLAFCACLLLFFASASTRAQVSQMPLPADAEAALESYRRRDPTAWGSLRQAIKNHRDDPDALYAIGMALRGEGVDSLAAEALELAVTLRPGAFPSAHAILAALKLTSNQSSAALIHAEKAATGGVESAELHYVVGEASFRKRDYAAALAQAEKALEANPVYPQAVLLKSKSLAQTGRLSEAAPELEKFLALAPDDADADAWRVHLDTLRALAAGDSAGGQTAARQSEVLKTNQVDSKAVILSKPEPGFTEEARKANAQGLVKLRAVLASDGTVKNVYVEQSLGYGLTAKAVAAIHKIQFNPAVKDGRPVSQWVTVEYNFNIY